MSLKFLRGHNRQACCPNQHLRIEMKIQQSNCFSINLVVVQNVIYILFRHFKNVEELLPLNTIITSSALRQLSC